MKLIDKDALVAWAKETYLCENASMIRKVCYKQLLEHLDTLEVKEAYSLTPEEIKKICTIYDNLNQERKCATILYNSDETFFNHVLMEYKTIAQKGE